MSNMDWVDEVNKEQQKGEYFAFKEGDNRIQLLTHCAQLVQRWTGSRYEVMVEGDSQEGKSIKGVCFILQDGEVKLAFLPYTVVKQIRELQNDPDWAFDSFPMPRMINVRAKDAGTKEVEYSVIPSPKESPVSDEVMAKVASNKTPEQIVEAMKEKRKGSVKPDVAPESEFDKVRGEEPKETAF